MHICNESSAPKISVVLSFRNEEKVIPELIRRLRAVLDGECSKGSVGGYELVFVNDASTDSSEELLKNAAKERADIKIISTSRIFGGSECVLAGMEYSSGDAVIYMDSDLQDPPELIPELIARWQGEEGVEVVYTTRRTRAGEHPLKLWLTKLGYRILHYISDIEIPFNSGDFKLLSRRAVSEVQKLHERKPYMRGLISWIGFKQAQIFYDRDARFAGETKYPFLGRRALSNFLDSALISFSDVPLKMALLLGFFVSIGAFLFLIWVFIHKFMGWALPGWSAMTAIVLVLGGVQLITIGVLGLYIGAIFRESKSRPNFIVKSTYGFENRSGSPDDTE